MDKAFFEPYITRIARLNPEEDGLTSHRHGKYRPDITAWAILALNAISPSSNASLIENARNRIAQDQHPDGSISISQDQPHAVWPTPLAIFAWNGALHHKGNQTRAVQFLLHHTGLHFEKEDGNAVIGHDTSIPGWPWITHTHSWVQPTALCMIALSINGHKTHQRVQDGERMLLNRQLPQGGWNYGNTTILRKELQPFPETTGIALIALSGRVAQSTVEPSLTYLTRVFPKLKTPLSLCWSLLGLRAWGIAPSAAQDRLMTCFKRESRYGQYDPVSLCLLLGTAVAQDGFKSLIPAHEISHM